MISLFRKIRQKLLEQNKVKRYMVYAIGEIVLVVIGILIAVQINDLYQNRKNSQIIKNNTELLIENLVKDSLFLVQWKENVALDRSNMSTLEDRMNSPSVIIDTLIQIASMEFHPGVNTVNFLNQSVFNTMVSTGEVNLFDKSLIEELYQLYAFEKRIEERSGYSFDHYLTAQNNYRSRYFFREDINLHMNPLHQQVWKSIDEEDFITAFNNMFNTKLLLYSQVGRSMELVQEDINQMLTGLREIAID